ncbi:MAG: DUF167 domain-containing protein [Candidatus Daviesbacteria bacterium]|nr:DUF167 domain-containing protein [Candidatus Daviesbacteria bacterium]
MKISVIVHPNSKRDLPAGRQGRIEKDLLNNLHVYVNQPPLEGKANKATILALADYFKVSKASVKLISGAKSKYKIFEILSEK